MSTDQTAPEVHDPLSLSLPVEIIAEEAVPADTRSVAVAPLEGVVEDGEPLDPELEGVADQFVDGIISADLSDGAVRQSQRRAVDQMGSQLQKQSAHRSAMLKEPIRAMAGKGEDGGPVASALVDLRTQLNDLDPHNVEFSKGGFAKLISFLPGVGSSVERYFLKFETAQEAIDGIIKSLESGKEILRRDNVTLSTDQGVMAQLMDQITKQVQLGRRIDQKLSARAQGLEVEDPRRKFVEEEVLFPLRQRVADLQQQLLVNQQGVLALELIIRNNRELIRGVDRAINVTVSALNVAVTVALALNNQRIVLEKVQALNATTSNLISGTARALRTQGAEIHKQASSTMLDMKALESAFTDITQAMDEIGRYRRDALPKLNAQIERLDSLATKGAEAIVRLERGRMEQDRLTGTDSPEASA